MSVVSGRGAMMAMIRGILGSVDTRPWRNGIWSWADVEPAAEFHQQEAGR